MESDGALASPQCSRIEAGVERTLAEGSAEVEIVLEYSFPGESAEGSPEAMSTHYRGTVDFRSDRAALTVGDTSLLLEGLGSASRSI